MAYIYDNVFMVLTLGVACLTWLITCVGACIFRDGITGGAWWILIYEFFLTAGICTAVFTGSFFNYRLTILTFLAASIGLVIYQLDYVVPVSKFEAVYRGGAGAYAAGYTILMMIQFSWIIIFGSEPNSYFGKYAPSSDYGNAVGVHHHRRQNTGGSHQQQQQLPQYHTTQAPYEMMMSSSTGDKTMLISSPDSANLPSNTISTAGAATPQGSFNAAANSTNNLMAHAIPAITTTLAPPTNSTVPIVAATSTTDTKIIDSASAIDITAVSASNKVTADTNTAAGTAATTTPSAVSSNLDYKEKVQALHAYQASPEDPNELSFKKGEILEIVDRTGNWWQARKANGVVGIIPSNYFSSS